MLLTVSEFRERVLGSSLEGLLHELVEQTGRNNPEERQAWERSFTRLARALENDALAPMHLYLGDLGGLSLEYRLPAASSWCDVVLLGNNGNLSMALATEAGELMEHFLWVSGAESSALCATSGKKAKIEEELADVVILALQFANMAKIDVAAAVETKIAKNAAKYPIAKAKGRSDKYTEL